MTQSECYCPFQDKFNNWDYLIILDACRYDFFAHLYHYFLYGTLKRVKSCGSCTYDFCINCLAHNKDRDIIYISANPYINSRKCIGNCYAKFYVSNIIDAWLTHWDDRLGSVPPDRVTALAIEIIKKYKDRRVVIHYLQPHAPYIVPAYKIVGYADPRSLQNLIFSTKDMERYSNLLNIEKKILSIVSRLQKLGLKSAYYVYLKARKEIGLPPLDPMDDFLRKYGIKELAKAYAKNLLLVLANVALLVKEIKILKPHARIVITADHGECLGEEGLLGHSSINHLCLRDIPLFEVQSSNVKLANRYVLLWRIRMIRSLKPFRKCPTM